MQPTLLDPVQYDATDATAPARHCCSWCAEEAIPERCPYYRFDWECAPSVDSRAPTTPRVAAAA